MSDKLLLCERNAILRLNRVCGPKPKVLSFSSMQTLLALADPILAPLFIIETWTCPLNAYSLNRPHLANKLRYVALFYFFTQLSTNTGSWGFWGLSKSDVRVHPEQAASLFQSHIIRQTGHSLTWGTIYSHQTMCETCFMDCGRKPKSQSPSTHKGNMQTPKPPGLFFLSDRSVKNQTTLYFYHDYWFKIIACRKRLNEWHKKTINIKNTKFRIVFFPFVHK